jgi:hypothetical protein
MVGPVSAIVKHLPMRFAAAAALGLILLSAGCTKDDADDSSEKMPECSDVWKAGARLPESYDGCMEGTRVVTPELLDCNDHGGQWTIYRDRLAGVLGGRVTSLPGPPDTESSQSSYFLRC